MKKFFKILFLSILIIITLCGITIYAVWHNEISTLNSFKLLRERNEANKQGEVYEIHVKGGFYFDKFIEQGGASNDKDLINFMTSNITRGLLKMNIEESNISCSAFTAKTKDGKVLFGRNYDFRETNSCIVYTDAGNGRHSTISSVDLRFLGIDPKKGIRTFKDKMALLSAPYAPLDGVNDAGLTCGIFMSYQGEKTVATDQNTDKPDITSTTMLRLILDYAGTIDEAIELISKYDLHDSANTSYHYMIADASGRSAILEWVPEGENCKDLQDNDGTKRKLNVIYNDDDSRIGEREGLTDYQVITNFIIQPNYYDNDSEKKGFDRYERVYSELEKTNAIVENEVEAMNVLAAVGRRGWNNDDKNSITVHSVIYNLTDKTALWVGNENYKDSTAVFKLTLDKK